MGVSSTVAGMWASVGQVSIEQHMGIGPRRPDATWLSPLSFYTFYFM